MSTTLRPGRYPDGRIRRAEALRRVQSFPVRGRLGRIGRIPYRCAASGTVQGPDAIAREVEGGEDRPRRKTAAQVETEPLHGRQRRQRSDPSGRPPGQVRALFRRPLVRKLGFPGKGRVDAGGLQTGSGRDRCLCRMPLLSGVLPSGPL